jgi:hypothetical protein
MPDKRTYADRREYLKKAVSLRRKKLKAMVIEYKGGVCIICGYDKYPGAFDLHHVDGSTKEFGLSSEGLTRSWEKTKAEADKCVLLCATCHREVHGGIAKLPKGLLKNHP